MAEVELPDGNVVGGRSPKRTYLIDDTGDSVSHDRINRISIARSDHPNRFYSIYTYPRFADLYFSPDERYPVINDRSGSGWIECALLTQIDKPPYLVNSHKIDEECWKLFWSLHKNAKKILYDHRSTYFCERLDASHIVVGLQGNHSFPDPGSQKWSLDGGWHCIYDVAHDKANTSKYADSKNSQCEFKIDGGQK